MNIENYIKDINKLCLKRSVFPSQKQLSLEMGITELTVGRLLNGKTKTVPWRIKVSIEDWINKEKSKYEADAWPMKELFEWLESILPLCEKGEMGSDELIGLTSAVTTLTIAQDYLKRVKETLEKFEKNNVLPY